MSKNLSENELIRMAAEIGAQAALDTLQKERIRAQKSRHDCRLRNTKMLLQNYRMFHEHVENAIFEMEQMDENAIDILDLMCENSSHELFVESIKKSVTRTTIIMRHVSEMLEIYKVCCFRSGKPEDERRFRVVSALYIEEIPMTARQIAEREGIDERTVYKDVDAAAQKLSALIFGIDGLKAV